MAEFFRLRTASMAASASVVFDRRFKVGPALVPDPDVVPGEVVRHAGAAHVLFQVVQDIQVEDGHGGTLRFVVKPCRRGSPDAGMTDAVGAALGCSGT
jgi:hypothetical protein